MKTVHFVADRSRIVDYLLTPVRVNKDRLRERGYRVRFFYRPSARALSCDILGMVSKPILQRRDQPEPVISESSSTVALLREARERAGKVVWFDSSDSTGVTHFELLPYIDLYLKKQLLRDRSGYRRPMYGGRPFSDYYHREFGIEDTTPFEQHFPLAEEDQDRVQLSWNIGLGELHHAFTWRSQARRLFPDWIRPRLDVPFTTPHNERTLDVFMRAAANWHRESVVFHRKELIRRLQAIIDEHGLTGSVTRRLDEKHLSLEEYRGRIHQTKIAFGPFGWGELNLREYEALMFGAMLLRADTSHMETWPEIFLDGETCAFYRWDFSDLEEKVLRYLEDDQERRRIATAGQDAYGQILSPSGMERFSDWFVQQIEL